MTLIVAGNRIEPTRESRIPGTPAGETTLALLTFELQAIASADDGVLEIGAEEDHKAKVPFGPDGGEARTLEPLELEPKGRPGRPPDHAAGGVLRWDLPDWSQELPRTCRP